MIKLICLTTVALNWVLLYISADCISTHFLVQIALRAKKHIEMLRVICYWSSMKILWFPCKIELVEFSVSQLLPTDEHQWSAYQTRRIKQGTSHCRALSVFKHGVSCINPYKLATVVWTLKRPSLFRSYAVLSKETNI